MNRKQWSLVMVWAIAGLATAVWMLLFAGCNVTVPPLPTPAPSPVVTNVPPTPAPVPTPTNAPPVTNAPPPVVTNAPPAPVPVPAPAPAVQSSISIQDQCFVVNHQWYPLIYHLIWALPRFDPQTELPALLDAIQGQGFNSILCGFRYDTTTGPPFLNRDPAQVNKAWFDRMRAIAAEMKARHMYLLMGGGTLMTDGTETWREYVLGRDSYVQTSDYFKLGATVAGEMRALDNVLFLTVAADGGGMNGAQARQYLLGVLSVYPSALVTHCPSGGKMSEDFDGQVIKFSGLQTPWKAHRNDQEESQLRASRTAHNWPVGFLEPYSFHQDNDGASGICNEEVCAGAAAGAAFHGCFNETVCTKSANWRKEAGNADAAWFCQWFVRHWTRPAGSPK